LTKAGSKPPGADGDGADAPLDDLARAAQSGDPIAREQFAVRLLGLVTNSVRSQIGKDLLRHVGFEDVVQEVLLKFQPEFPRLRVRNEPMLRNWVHTFVRNRICDIRDRIGADKRDANRNGLEPDLTFESEPGPHEAASRRELSERAATELERLSLHESVAIRRIAIGGERISDVARELGVGESTVRMRLSRGLARLAYALGMPPASRRPRDGGPRLMT
jgi:RNA polymerase sigma factor (sigma-70 family)